MQSAAADGVTAAAMAAHVFRLADPRAAGSADGSQNLEPAWQCLPSSRVRPVAAYDATCNGFPTPSDLAIGGEAVAVGPRDGRLRDRLYNEAWCLALRRRDLRTALASLICAYR